MMTQDRIILLLTAIALGAAAVRIYCDVTLSRLRRRLSVAEECTAKLDGLVASLQGQVSALEEQNATLKELYSASLERNAEALTALGKSNQIRRALAETMRRRDQQTGARS